MLNHHHLSSEIRALGHELYVAGWAKHHLDLFDYTFQDPLIDLKDILAILPDSFEPTHILYHDNSEAPHILGLETCSIPTLFYAVDTHIHGSWQPYFSLAFDTVLVAQKDYITSFTQVGANASWLPLWATVNLEPSKNKDINVCFRGNLDKNIHPLRAQFFQALSNYIPGDYGSGPFQEAFPRSKIIINQSLSKEVNFRVFEAMISGALLITPRIENGLLNLFTDKVDLVTYCDNDPEDAANKIKYYLANPLELEKIAQQGRKKILDHHTPLLRARDLVSKLSESRHSQNPNTCLGLAKTFLFFFKEYRGIDSYLSLRYLEAAASNIKQYIKHGFDASSLFIENFICCQFCLELSNQTNEALNLLLQAREIYPDNKILKLSHLQFLNFNQESESARILGLEICPDLTLAFNMANQLFSGIKRSFEEKPELV